jgi:predicted metal-binding membrane protein
MAYGAPDLARVRNSVLLLSAATWILLLAEPYGMVARAHFHAARSRVTPLGPSFHMLLAMNPPAALAANWLLMLVAMMAPVLIPPIRHIRQRSFKRRRARATALFAAGYGAIWMAVGAVALSIDLAVNLFAPQSYLPAAALLLLASVWQFSPIKQRCLNRCHAHTALAAFGAAADRDALRFGLRHGIWCAASCWALMLFPLLLPRGHAVAMIAVAFLIFGERLERPMPPSWRWRGLGSVTRIAIAQARIRADWRAGADARPPLYNTVL